MGNTKAIVATVLAVAILGIMFVSLAAANGNNSSSYIANSEAKEELVAFIDEAKDFVLAEGRDKALQVFNDSKGNFSRGELYIVAMDTNGTLLADPYEPESTGKPLEEYIDSNGVAFAKILDGLAKRESGFSYFIHPNPAHSNAVELKLEYAQKADGGLYLLSGMYLPGPTPVFSNESRKDLIDFVVGAREFALNHTKEEALKAFSDPKGKFVKEELYINAYDFNGTRLAHPYLKIGENALNVTDPNGVAEVRDRIDLAANYGNGFTYYLWSNPARSNALELKLAYVAKINDDWFISSGIYMPGA
jgi:polar amino acid transport system substrate-binding protein